MPRINDLIDQLSQEKKTSLWTYQGITGKFLSLKCKTAFINQYGLYEFLVMPFDLCGATPTS